MLTKKEFDSFRMETEQAMKAIAEKYNVNIKSGKIGYTMDSFEMKLLVTKKEVNGKSFEQAEFEKDAIYYGFSPSDYNREFTSHGKTFNLIGFKSSARTMPVLAKGTDGKTYKFVTDDVMRLMGIKTEMRRVTPETIGMFSRKGDY